MLTNRQLYLPQATRLAAGFEREDSPTRTHEIHPTKSVPPFPTWGLARAKRFPIQLGSIIRKNLRLSNRLPGAPIREATAPLAARISAHADTADPLQSAHRRWSSRRPQTNALRSHRLARLAAAKP
jgi:hypothetical protein